ncbi:hypothetical protein CFC21_065524 [Triticum aestivum]|uniref:Uncharacterized protein n=3 Tax=Triticum TaxID=4564 RepID=A0A9R0TTU7_TRITD|nr:hypothetical protein CFC21_065524 [Triticum aestivum]VAI17175.1 unnamed protein product [Triticum turgidum subsp. durum]
MFWNLKDEPLPPLPAAISGPSPSISSSSPSDDSMSSGGAGGGGRARALSSHVRKCSVMGRSAWRWSESFWLSDTVS